MAELEREHRGRLHATLLGHQIGHEAVGTKRLRITSKFLVLLAEREELGTNILLVFLREPGEFSRNTAHAQLRLPRIAHRWITRPVGARP